jgi:hypothetical protein
MQGMARATRKPKTQAEELWELYRSIQLTPGQKAAARERATARAEQARLEGVYERVREMAGTVKWSISWQSLRKEE